MLYPAYSARVVGHVVWPPGKSDDVSMPRISPSSDSRIRRRKITKRIRRNVGVSAQLVQTAEYWRRVVAEARRRRNCLNAGQGKFDGQNVTVSQARIGVIQRCLHCGFYLCHRASKGQVVRRIKCKYVHDANDRWIQGRAAGVVPRSFRWSEQLLGRPHRATRRDGRNDALCNFRRKSRLLLGMCLPVIAIDPSQLSYPIRSRFQSVAPLH